MIEIKNQTKLLFIGDSITDLAFNRRMAHKIKGRRVYAKQVTDTLKHRYKGMNFIFKGIASNRSYHVYDRLTNDCISHKPDVIVLLIGVNDAWEHYKPEDYPPLLRPFDAHMKEIFRRIKAELPDTKLMILLPFLIDTMPEKQSFHIILNEYRNALREMAEPFATEIIDLQAVFDKAAQQIPCKDLATDGVHPTNLGHKQIADAILEKLC